MDATGLPTTNVDCGRRVAQIDLPVISACGEMPRQARHDISLRNSTVQRVSFRALACPERSRMGGTSIWATGRGDPAAHLERDVEAQRGC